jgi:hypothetical protein
VACGDLSAPGALPAVREGGGGEGRARVIAPLPYRIGKNGAIVSDCPPGCKATERRGHGSEIGPGAGDDHEEWYGGHFVCESVTGEQAAFIVRACNSHETLVAALEGLGTEDPRDGSACYASCFTDEGFDSPQHFPDCLAARAAMEKSRA